MFKYELHCMPHSSLRECPTHQPGMKSARRGKTGFTLVELIAVIAVILILAAILVSITGRVLQSSKASKCTSKLRQIGIAARAFAADNDGNMLTSGDANSSSNPTPWFKQIAPYLGGKDATTVNAQVIENLSCPAAADYPTKSWTNLTSGSPKSYGWNWRINNWDSSQTVSGFDPIKKFAGIDRPAQVPMIVEVVFQNNFDPARGGIFDLAEPPDYDRGNITGLSKAFSKRHGKGSNVLWFDGHVSFVTFSEFKALPAKQGITGGNLGMIYTFGRW